LPRVENPRKREEKLYLTEQGESSEGKKKKEWRSLKSLTKKKTFGDKGTAMW